MCVVYVCGSWNDINEKWRTLNPVHIWKFMPLGSEKSRSPILVPELCEWGRDKGELSSTHSQVWRRYVVGYCPSALHWQMCRWKSHTGLCGVHHKWIEIGLQQVQGRCLCEDNCERAGPSVCSIRRLYQGGRDTLVQCLSYPGAFWVMGQFSGFEWCNIWVPC